VPDKTAVVILAAGAGTRMRSSLPKPLHPIAGTPMIDYVAASAVSVDPERVVIVLSPSLEADGALIERLRHLFGDQLAIAVQPEPLGTGHALRVALPSLGSVDRTLVVFADHPLLTANHVRQLCDAPIDPGRPLALLTSTVDDAGGYGRIVRNESGAVVRIAERKDDAPADRSGPTEVNSGMMAISAAWLSGVTDRLKPSTATGEIYLTQLVELATAAHLIVNTVSGDGLELLGVNDRAELAVAETEIYRQNRQAHMTNGVGFTLPETTTVERDVRIGADTVILPGCHLSAGTTIGSRCIIGPNTVLTRATIADDCRVGASWIEDSILHHGADVGPFSHIRGGSEIGPDAHIGNFSEIKTSRLAADVRMGHFGYIGDATVGRATNIGAGVVTCNFDGIAKHPTTIGNSVFVGSDTMLVAPVTIGDGSTTGAGSVVTRDVPAGARVAGVPAKPLIRQGEGK